jgi:hypothetical protein
MTSQCKMLKKRRINVLLLVQKIEILNKLISGVTVASLARAYKTNESSVMSNEETIR